MTDPTNPVAAWLANAGLGDYAPAFQGANIGLDQLHRLTDNELSELGLSLDCRIQFKRAAAANEPLSPSASAPELRPITVVFLDLVDSTALSDRLDHDDFLATLGQYYEACCDAILRYGGQVLQLHGDGILAVFCLPAAHEDDPERGVRAALHAVGAISRLRAPDGPPISARAGVATGRVLVGARFGKALNAAVGKFGEALGSTLHLAARLQAMASPGGVIIAAETAARLRGHFALEDMGFHPLRGFAATMQMFRVTSERSRRVRPPDAQHVAAFIGREEELALLHGLWKAARGGCGGTALIRGEAGIGKSRLLKRFIDSRTGRREDTVLAIYGSPFHLDEPLWPIQAALRGLVDAGAKGRAGARSRLQRILLANGANSTEEAPLTALAELLGVADEHDSAWLQDMSPSRLKALTLDALVTSALRVARMRPLLLVVEDAHWLDPTTLELVDRLIAEAPTHLMMVLLAAREQYSLPMASVRTIDLRGLGEVDATRLFTSICGDRASPKIGREMAVRTAGVPLFVEEFARAVARSGTSETPPIPATLHECLAAKLDRAGPAKAVAQAAAVLGLNDVRAAPLALVAGLPETVIKDALVHLERVGLLERGSVPSVEGWSFRHALLRETAYDSLLRDRRQLLHSRAADALASESEPAILAHHLSAAARFADSVPHFLSAARRSLARSAQQEAVSLLNRGLTALDALPASARRRKKQLELMALLGPALIGLHGPGAQVTQKLYAEAVALARDQAGWEEHFPIFWGWWRLSHLQDFNESRDRAAWLYSEVRHRHDRGLLLQAHHCNWAAFHNQGDIIGSARHIKAGLALYRVEEHRDHASLYGNHDAKVCGHAHRALGLWQRGLAYAAEAEEAEAVAWAQQLGHVGSMLHALEFALVHRAYRRNPQEVRLVADRLLAMAEEYGYGHYSSRCRIFHGWAMAMQGDAKQGAKLAADALATERDVNTADDFAVFHCLVAEAWVAAGEPERALDDLKIAQAGFDRIGLHHWLPEVWRMIGDLTLILDPTAAVGAAEAYAKACRLAKQQGAHRLALRAANRMERIASLSGGQSAVLSATAWRCVPEFEVGADELGDAAIFPGPQSNSIVA